MTTSDNSPSPQPATPPEYAMPGLNPAHITGLILAGGRGSRMGQTDKGLLPFQGHTLLAQVLARLHQQVGTVIINANQHTLEYQQFGYPVVKDHMAGFAGPLAGFQAGLSLASTPWVLTTPCDSPFLPLDLAARLGQAVLQQNADLAVAATLDPDTGKMQMQPVFCLLKTGLLPHLNAHLAGGGRKIAAWFADLTVARVVFDDASAFDNLNTPEQLQQANARASLPGVGAAPGATPCLN